MQELIHVPAALLPIQPPVNGLGTAAEDGLAILTLTTHLYKLNEALGFCLAQHWPWCSLVSEPAGGSAIVRAGLTKPGVRILFQVSHVVAGSCSSALPGHRQDLVLSWPSSDFCEHWGKEPADGRTTSGSLSLSFSVSLPFK